MARRNKMPHWKSRKGKAFPMNGKSVNCAQCNTSISKKQSHATEVKLGKTFNRSKEQSFRKNKPTDNTAPRKREATPVVVSVRRVCRNGCN